MHETSGLIIPPNDPNAIRKAIRRVMENAVLWTALAVAGRKRVEEEFMWPTVVDRCMRAYGLVGLRPAAECGR